MTVLNNDQPYTAPPAQAARVPDRLIELADDEVSGAAASAQEGGEYDPPEWALLVLNAASAPAEKQTRSELPEGITNVRNAATGESVRVDKADDALLDALTYGAGFTRDGKHVPYEDVFSVPAPDGKAAQKEILGKQCIDGGTCHHSCVTYGKCFRRAHCSPFSDYDGPWDYDTPATPQEGRDNG